jgi:hypothetical protein
MTEYYKCILDSTDRFTEGRIYKIITPSDLETPFNFIDDKGKKNGWSGKNYEHFIPATLEEWLIQEGKIKADYFYLINFFNQNNIK